MKLVIDRSRWLRGEKDSMLLRPRDNKMCCLGFHCLALGLQEAQIKGMGTPEELDYKDLTFDQANKLAEAQLVRMEIEYDDYTDPDDEPDGVEKLMDTAIVNKLVQTNDSTTMLDALREATLVRLFADIDVEVEFIN